METFHFGDAKSLEYLKLPKPNGELGTESYFKRDRVLSQDSGGWTKKFSELQASSKRSFDYIRGLGALVRVTNDMRSKFFLWKYVIKHGGCKGDLYIDWYKSRVFDAVYGKDGFLNFLETKYAKAYGIQEATKFEFHIDLTQNFTQGQKKPELAPDYSFATLDARHVDPDLQNKLMSLAEKWGYPTYPNSSRFQVIVMGKEEFNQDHCIAVFPKNIQQSVKRPGENTLTRYIYPRCRFDDPWGFSLLKEGSLYELCLGDNGEVPLKKPWRGPPPPLPVSKYKYCNEKWAEMCKPVNGHLTTRTSSRGTNCTVCKLVQTRFYCGTCSYRVYLCSRDCMEAHGQYPKYDTS